MSRARAAASHDATEERLQRALEENNRLRAEVKERDEKLKRVQTQFRKLSADWRLSQEGRPATSPASASLRSVSVNSPALPAVQLRRTADTPKVAQRVSWSTEMGSVPTDLAACQAALAQARGEVTRLQGTVQQLQQELLQQQQQQQQQSGAAIAAAHRGRLPSLPTASTASPTPHQQRQVEELNQQLTNARAEHQTQLAAMQQQLFQTQSELQHAQLALQQQQNVSSAASAANMNAQQQLELQYRDALDKLARERDGLSVRLRILEEERKSTSAAPLPDPLSLVQLQGEVRERSAQVTLLNSRLQSAQAQVEALKGECARLVEELRHAHTAHAEVGKQLFQLEHEKGTLQARCGRLEEVELLVQRKNEELLRMEQELLRLMDALRTCNTDTEQAVRREMNARIADLQAMRDEADAQRREKERALLQCQSELADARRRITSLTQDIDVYRVELSKAEKEKAEMAAHAAFAGHTASEFSDEEVHRALAVAAMRRRGQSEREAPAAPGDAPAATSATAEHKEKAQTAADALDLYDALHWDETWEQGQMREALAAAALDMELAETRCQQLADQAQQSRAALQKVSEERDTLLEENLEMRRRITGVQTVLAKQQLQAFRQAQAQEGGLAREQGSIDLRVRGLRCTSPGMEKALGVANLSEPVSLFLTLDGLSDYDTMLSPNFHGLQANAPLDLHFRYDRLDVDAATVGVVQQTNFVFQLHRATPSPTAEADEPSTLTQVVAMAELPGAALLAAREATTEEALRLIDGAGNVVGTLFVDVRCAGLMLPVLLGQPLADAALLSAAEMRAVLVALRAVRAIRVQVFKAQGLPRRTVAVQRRKASQRVRQPNHDVVEVLDSNEDRDTDGDEATREAAGPSHSTDLSLAGLPQPYVFYTAQSPAAARCEGGENDPRSGIFLHAIADTVVHTASDAFTTDPVFDASPVDHRVAVDRELVRFIAQGTIVFVVFDERATDVRSHLGMVEVPLHPLLVSPQAVIHATEPLHPQGSLSFGISWVTGP